MACAYKGLWVTFPLYEHRLVVVSLVIHICIYCIRIGVTFEIPFMVLSTKASILVVSILKPATSCAFSVRHYG